MASNRPTNASANTDDREPWPSRDDFAQNPEPRCPCALLLDNSGSMAGDAIEQLNNGIVSLRDDVLRDPIANKRVEIAIVTFGGEARVIQPFVTIDGFAPPILEAGGETPMGAAILRGLDLIDVRKQDYKDHGIAYYRPWMFLITDGEPQGEPNHVTQEATRRIREAQDARRVTFFAVGVEGANMSRLASFCVNRQPARLKGLQFIELFMWLSASMSRVSQSRIGDEVRLPPLGWTIV